MSCDIRVWTRYSQDNIMACNESLDFQQAIYPEEEKEGIQGS